MATSTKVWPASIIKLATPNRHCLYMLSASLELICGGNWCALDIHARTIQERCGRTWHNTRAYSEQARAEVSGNTAERHGCCLFSRWGAIWYAIFYQTSLRGLFKCSDLLMQKAAGFSISQPRYKSSDLMEPLGIYEMAHAVQSAHPHNGRGCERHAITCHHLLTLIARNCARDRLSIPVEPVGQYRHLVDLRWS